MFSLPQYIEREQGNFLTAQTGSGDATRTRRALQEIARLYRGGWRFLPEQVIGVELAAIGLVMSSEDAKVRRWALNTMAQLGTESRSKIAISHALQTYHADAEVLAAAIAALYRLCKGAATELRKMGFNEQMVALAALQHVPASKLNLSCLPLRVDHADTELLKLGLVVVGVDRAPPRLFEPNHDNATIVRVLGAHHDPIVSQYSVWAVTENPSLGVTDLGEGLLKDIEQRPANVRAWVFQLLASESGSTDDHAELIELGIGDDSTDARLGLAMGLKNAFSPKLAPMVLEWFTREMNFEIRSQILDHLTRQAERHEAYKHHVLGAFERGGADAQDRMLAIAAGSPLYSTLSTIKYNGGINDLFRGATFVNNKTINLGNVNAGAFSVEGEARNAGDAVNTVTYNTQTIELIRSHLDNAEQEVKKSVADAANQKEALFAIDVAKKEPTKDNVGKVVATLGRLESEAQKVLGIGTALAGIAKLIAQAAGIS